MCSGEMAYHGHRVTLYDSNVNTLNGVYYRLNEDKQNLREEGLLPTNNFVVSYGLLYAVKHYNFEV